MSTILLISTHLHVMEASFLTIKVTRLAVDTIKRNRPSEYIRWVPGFGFFFIFLFTISLTRKVIPIVFT